MTSTGHRTPMTREHYWESIRTHLESLLNSHHDFCPHTTDYGVPDLADLYRSLPGKTAPIAESIRDAIVKFEPRLSLTDILVETFLPEEFALRLFVKARTKTDAQDCAFHVDVSSQGRVSVRVKSGVSYG